MASVEEADLVGGLDNPDWTQSNNICKVRSAGSGLRGQRPILLVRCPSVTPFDIFNFPLAPDRGANGPVRVLLKVSFKHVIFRSRACSRAASRRFRERLHRAHSHPVT